MIRTYAFTTTTPEIAVDQTYLNTHISNVQMWIVHWILWTRSIFNVRILITKFNNFIIQRDTKANSVRSILKVEMKLVKIKIKTKIWGKIKSIREIKDVLMDNFVPSLTNNPKLASNWFTKWKRIFNSIYFTIRQFGVR